MDMDDAPWTASPQVGAMSSASSRVGVMSSGSRGTSHKTRRTVGVRSLAVDRILAPVYNRLVGNNDEDSCSMPDARGWIYRV